MSVDTVIYAITRQRIRFTNSPESFSPEGQRKVLAILDCMRDPLLKEDIAGFDNYVDSLLAREPDAADFVLEELFEQLNIKDREELSAKLLEA
jgi:hypothetical protein